MGLMQKALTYHTAGNLAQAVGLYNIILADSPNDTQALANCAGALSGLGQPSAAVELCDRLLQISPNNGSALCTRGNALMALDRPTDALAAYRQALVADLTSASSWNNEGNALCSLGQLEKAEESYTRALALQPHWPLALANRSRVRLRLGHREEALADIVLALSIEPGFVGHHIHHASLLNDLHRPEACLVACDVALALDQTAVLAHYYKGSAYAYLNRHADALTSFGTAIALQPELANAHFSEALCHLATGDFAKGWPKYEWRWEAQGLNPLKNMMPQWRGEPLDGKTIIVLSEQGLGDSLQFVRFLPQLQARGAFVVLAIPTPLRPLMPPNGPGLRVIVEGDSFPMHDYTCPMMSLPYALEIDVRRIPSATPYLVCQTDWSKPWLDRIGQKTQPRVGVVWSGSATHGNDANRSIPLARFMAVFDDSCEFISLQPDVRPSDEAAMAACPALRDVRAELTSFEATAGLIATLDLVITVDTAIAHLTGGLGKPVWILLPFAADWRWLTERADSPWYPTARLWRQAERGDWDSLLSNVRVALQDYRI